MEKVTFFKQAGYALVAVGLILLMVLASAGQLYSPRVGLYSYGLLFGGLFLVLISKGVGIIQYHRWQKLTAQCLCCGWVGTGKALYRYQSCPDCDSDQVVLHRP